MKLVRRVTAWLGLLTGFMVLGVTSAMASPNYPPTTPPGTEVKGVKVGQVSGDGLPHTGFDPSLVWIALGLILLGAVALVATRRRSSKHS
jgi:LPXTG-motif cell wall-anchored protein